MKKITLEAKTHNQAEYIRSIYENTLTIVESVSGTGKTLIACGIAAKMLQNKEVGRIICIRPLTSVGKDVGWFTGDLSNKIAPYMIPLEDNLKQFFEFADYQKLKETKVIEYLPLETLRGITLHNCFIILDEAQNTTLSQIKMLLTRVGEGTKVVVTGDTDQTDISYSSGFAKSIEIVKEIPSCNVVTLGDSDIQRSKFVKNVILAYRNAGC